VQGQTHPPPGTYCIEPKSCVPCPR
jgi:hypothetical protein